MYNPQDQWMGKRCSHCNAGTFVQNPYEHPSYVECDSCGAMQLTYIPMDHQYEFHNTPYRYNKNGTIATHTFGLFGGRKFRSLQLKNKPQIQGNSKG